MRARIDAAHLEGEADVAADRLPGQQHRGLKDDADARMRSRDRASPDMHVTPVRGVEPGDDPHQRALATPRGTHDGGELPTPDVQRDTVESRHGAEPLRDVADLDMRAHVPSGRSRPRMLTCQGSARRSAASTA
jgi:hypothetical protein